MSVKSLLKYSESAVVAWIDADVLVYSCAHAAQSTTWTHPEIPKETWAGKTAANQRCDELNLERKDLIGLIKPEPFSTCKRAFDMSVTKIRKATDASRAVLFLTGKGNYRAKIYPEYKANRVADKPAHYQTLRDYILMRDDSILINGREADDALGIAQSLWTRGERPMGRSVICTIDKDLDMIRGWHYNWQKDEKYYIGGDDADLFFYRQLITGDATDNIKGIPKKGKKAAEEALTSAMTARGMYTTVHLMYQDYYIDPVEAQKMLQLNADLLWIQRESNVLWTPPNGDPRV